MANTMKAVFKIKPELGAVMQDGKIPQVKDDEVLLKVRATSICGTDVHIYRWDKWSENRIGAKALPQILGHEMAGDIVEIGRGVKGFKIGDYVSVETHIPNPADIQTRLGQMHIGENMQIVGVDRNGTFAEYIAVPAVVCWVNDKAIPPDIACIQEPLGNAAYAVLGDDNDIAGKSMVILGDGPIALFAVGVARACGVTNIIINGQSDFNLEIAKQMGADHVIRNIDDKHDDRVEFVKDQTNGFGVDIVLDMAGAPSALDEGFKMLRKGGRFSAFGVLSEGRYLIDYNDGIVFKGALIHGISGRKMFDTWYRVGNLLSSGRLNIKPVITHRYMLEDFKIAFDKLMELPRCAAKIILFPEKSEFDRANARG